MNKLYNFVVVICGTVQLVKLTSEVFDVYRKVGTGFTKVGELSSDNPALSVQTAGDYFIASPEGHMCLSNVVGFFTYTEGSVVVGHGHTGHQHNDHPTHPTHPTHHHHHHPHLLPANIALKVLPDGTDALGNPAFVLAITQAGEAVGQTLKLKAILDTTGDVVAYEIPVV